VFGIIIFMLASNEWLSRISLIHISVSLIMKLANYYSLYDELNPKVSTEKFINTATKKVNR
jgi:hypothetical protein